MMKYINQAYNEPTPDGVNIGLYFQLAKADPDCRPTTGIIHVDAGDDQEYGTHGVHYGNAAGGISQEELAAKSHWDNTRYLNIWVVFGFSNPNILALAFYPSGVRTVFDGVVMRYEAVDGQSTTAVHEIGHAFNLLHTFEGSDGASCPLNNDCSMDGDFVCDTPPVPGTTGCNPLNINPCTHLPFGNLVYNYMSYSCRHLFTPMQRDRMRSALFSYRNSLLTSNAEWPSPQPPSITIMVDDADNIFDKGQLVTFTSSVTASGPIKYQWLKNGYLRSTGITYSTSDLQHGDEIVCKIQDTSIACYLAYSNTIKISTDHKHFVDIYPNPATDVVNSWTRSDDIKISGIRLFSANGQLMDEKQVTPSSRVQYSLKNKPAGIYFIEFTTNKGKDVVKAVKVY
jgi:hypothetical protein